MTESGYYAWLKRPESERKRENKRLLLKIRIVHAESGGSYGSIRVHRELRDMGLSCGRHRVARLMRANGIKAKAARKFKATTNSAHSHHISPNLLERNFDVSVPNQVWAGDVTYLWSKEGWLYLAVVLDLYSRKVVGWAASKRNDAKLVTLAYERAVSRRRPGEGFMFHSDRGSPYASKRFRRALRSLSVQQSMSKKGDCWDNAVVESFFHSLKVERIAGKHFTSRQEIKYVLFDYIERFYNRKRRHSTLGYLAPDQYEAAMAQAA